MTHDGEASCGGPGPLARVLAEVAAERAAQDAMWGVQDFPDGTGPTTPAVPGAPTTSEGAGRGATDAGDGTGVAGRAGVGFGGGLARGVGEDAGEAAERAKREVTEAAARGALTWRHVLHEEVLEAFAEDEPAALRAELIQVAAVVVKWVQALDRRREPPPRRDAQRFRAIVDVHVLLLRPAAPPVRTGPDDESTPNGLGGGLTPRGPEGFAGSGPSDRLARRGPEGGPMWNGPGDGVARGLPGGVLRAGGTGARVREVLMGRRRGTGYGDGLWHLPSGHLEAGESVVRAAVREAREEVGVVVDPDDLTFVHVMHRAPDRVGLFFAANRWAGEPYNAEPHKCSELGWWPLDRLPADMVGYPAAALARIRDGVPFAHHEWLPGH